MRPVTGAHSPVCRALIAAMATGLVAACAIPSDGPRLSPATPATMGLASASAPLQTTPAPAIAPEWWHALADPQLDRLMADALAGNPTLAGAEARLAAARAGLGEARAGLLPQISADASLQRQRFSAEFIYPPPYGGSYFWVNTAEADLSWSLDLAGRQKALVRAAGAQADAAALDAAAARVALSGAVAQAYVSLARAETQLGLAGESVSSRREWLTLARARSSSGLAGDLELRAAEGALAGAEQAEDRARGERDLVRHALAALAGRGADYAAGIAPPTLLPDAALPVPPRLSADLLGQRADILAARARIAAAGSERRAARAAFYPDIDLAAFIGPQALGLGALTDGAAMALGVGPALHLPIFEGGRLSASYRAATAGEDIAIAAYNATVVQAVREATDALSAVDTAKFEAARQREVVESLTASAGLSRERLRAGLAARQELVSANEALLTARQAMADIAAEGAIRRIRLAVALGGGFTAPSSSGAIAATLPSAQRP